MQSERQIGMAVGQIPWQSILLWSKIHGIDDPDDFDVLLRYVRALEVAADEHRKKKEKENHK